MRAHAIKVKTFLLSIMSAPYHLQYEFNPYHAKIRLHFIFTFFFQLYVRHAAVGQNERKINGVGVCAGVHKTDLKQIETVAKAICFGPKCTLRLWHKLNAYHSVNRIKRRRPVASIDFTSYTFGRPRIHDFLRAIRLREMP